MFSYLIQILGRYYKKNYECKKILKNKTRLKLCFEFLGKKIPYEQIHISSELNNLMIFKKI